MIQKLINLSNDTVWTREDFTKEPEDKEIEMVCNCLICLVKIPNLSLSILACPSCKS